ncbi:MAG: hypothetical protein KJO59_09645, partial [Ignavibacteria bacterium]|nr:hypothetical protein [Ignavibacteria bacterium]
MKGVIVHSARTKVVTPGINQIFLKFFLLPLKAGLYGFAAFFTLLIATKTVLSLLGYSDEFLVNTADVLQ